MMADGRSLPLDLGQELVVDLFAGGGGASLGLARAYREPDVAVNHDPVAIAVHRANHPDTEHFTCDVFEVDPVAATRGRPVGVLWASPDCRHHSKAKGGRPRSKRVRGLAWVVVSPPALGQNNNAGRPRGDYAMLAGQILGSEEDGLYIIDSANQEMACLQFDRTRRAMRFIGFRDLAADARAASTRSR